jgi:phenylpropionate dioxygenase-like ring-hydroxylating dioxygenase large terminal subunit
MSVAETGPSGDGNAAVRQDLRVVHVGKDPRNDPRHEIPVLGFRQYWYPVINEARVPKRKPVRVLLLGDSLCVFRGKTGVAVISDWCPHRGASLAGGLCNYAGTVSCPYHGWTFDESGACVAVLSEGPDSAVPGRASVRKYPTVTLKGIVFAWMGDGVPSDPRVDLPPELFDDSFVQYDQTMWNANWRPSMENLSDNHAVYTHRNSIQLLLQPFRKARYHGASTVYVGGAAPLNYVSDGTEKTLPYQEYFPAVDGLWPRHKYRLLWVPIFRLKRLRWLWSIGDGLYWDEVATRKKYHPDSAEWNTGPHMPGMQRINGGTSIYTRWCVPVDENTTREVYFYATRPKTSKERWIERIKYPIAQKLFRNRNLGFQDGRILERTRYDMQERFSAFDVETIGWRRLAILSARHGGRHDRIPQEIIERLNSKTEHPPASSTKRPPVVAVPERGVSGPDIV